MTKPRIKIGKRVIGEGLPTYIIAEMSANHNQSFEEASRIAFAARDCGADAIKLQTYTADTITINCDNYHFRIGGGTIWDGRKLYDLYSEAATPWSWQPKIKKLAEELGLDCFSTPFDNTAVDFLESIEIPAYKVASFELVDTSLIKYIARTGKPTIISTGMATLEEIGDAVKAFHEGGGTQLALLKCTSAYPAVPNEINLRTIGDMESRYNVPVGLSDHTLGISVPVAAVAIGACIIEKHLTISRQSPGPDSKFSLEPDEFKEMVRAVRDAEAALGGV